MNVATPPSIEAVLAQKMAAEFPELTAVTKWLRPMWTLHGRLVVGLTVAKSATTLHLFAGPPLDGAKIQRWSTTVTSFNVPISAAADWPALLARIGDALRDVSR
jgi:hypothetical protein